MEIKIVPFKVEHLDVMDMRGHEKQFCSNKQQMKILQDVSIACTGVGDGRILCCGGVTPTLPGVGSIWLIPSEYIQDSIIHFSRNLRDWLFQVREDLALHRMETDCIDDDLHNRWMEYLGFTNEGKKLKYFLKKDYNMWGRTWE